MGICAVTVSTSFHTLLQTIINPHLKHVNLKNVQNQIKRLTQIPLHPSLFDNTMKLNAAMTRKAKVWLEFINFLLLNPTQ